MSVQLGAKVTVKDDSVAGSGKSTGTVVAFNSGVTRRVGAKVATNDEATVQWDGSPHVTTHVVNSLSN